MRPPQAGVDDSRLAQADLARRRRSARARRIPRRTRAGVSTSSRCATGVMGRDLRLTSLFLLGVVGFVSAPVLRERCQPAAGARQRPRARAGGSLGARRRTSRIVAQLLTESLVLASLGGVLGVAYRRGDSEVSLAMIPAGLLPAAATFVFDGRVLASSARSRAFSSVCSLVSCRRGRPRGRRSCRRSRPRADRPRARGPVSAPVRCRRSGGSGAAAVRRRVVAAHSAGCRRLRSRISRRRR